MKQLLLDVTPRPLPTLGNFVAGANAELLEMLAARASGLISERFIYIWGESGAGKSHLLRAFAAAAQGCYIAAEHGERIAGADPNGAVALDDVERLSDALQLALFRLYTDMRAGGGLLLASGGQAPPALAVRPELASRLAWGLVFQVHALSDAEKRAALMRHAHARGLTLSPEVISYMLTHCRRDLSSLTQLASALDRHSLETRRAVTVPLLKEILQSASDLES
jgi:DnaA-homolog protein